MPRAAALLLAAASCACGVAARADQVWTAAPDDVLASMRGGFALDGGLLVSFGIVRTVLADGQVVARTALQIPDLGSMTGAQAQQLASQTAGLMVVQGGAGNSFQPLQGTLPGIVVQNTQNNRQLQAITEITATTHTLRMLQGLRLNQALGDALRGALAR
jgi:hypothetical protein